MDIKCSEFWSGDHGATVVSGIVGHQSHFQWYCQLKRSLNKQITRAICIPEMEKKRDAFTILQFLVQNVGTVHV